MFVFLIFFSHVIEFIVQYHLSVAFGFWAEGALEKTQWSGK
jgi:hypothetical protein